MPIEIRVLGPEDRGILENVGEAVFDDPIVPARAAEFLDDPRHHIAAALDAGILVGFASSVHYVHPDKQSPEMWINEVGVAATHRGRGIGKMVIGALLSLAQELGCSEAWVLTDRKNAAAMRLYAGSGGVEDLADGVLSECGALETVSKVRSREGGCCGKR